MKNISRLALGLAAVLVAAPAFAECPGHSSVTADNQSTPAPVAQSTAPSTAPAGESTVILTQNNQSQQPKPTVPPQE